MMYLQMLCLLFGILIAANCSEKATPIECGTEEVLEGEKAHLRYQFPEGIPKSRPFSFAVDHYPNNGVRERVADCYWLTPNVSHCDDVKPGYSVQVLRRSREVRLSIYNVSKQSGGAYLAQILAPTNRGDVSCVLNVKDAVSSTTTKAEVTGSQDSQPQEETTLTPSDGQKLEKEQTIANAGSGDGDSTVTIVVVTVVGAFAFVVGIIVVFVVRKKRCQNHDVETGRTYRTSGHASSQPQSASSTLAGASSTPNGDEMLEEPRENGIEQGRHSTACVHLISDYRSDRDDATSRNTESNPESENEELPSERDPEPGATNAYSASLHRRFCHAIQLAAPGMIQRVRNKLKNKEPPYN